MTMIERAQAVAADLTGTCRAIYEFATEEEQNNAEFCTELDALVFCCSGCEWWCDADEEQDGQCEDCNGDRDRDY